TGDTGIFFNGEHIDSFIEAPQQAAGQLSDTDGLHIGSDQHAEDAFFAGQIDEVAVWNRALGQDELATLWNDGNGHAPPRSHEEPVGTPGWWQPIYDGDVPGDYGQPEAEEESPEPQEDETPNPEDEEGPQPDEEDPQEPEDQPDAE